MLERGALAGLCIHRDRAAQLLHDAVHQRKAEAGSLVGLLGGEEGIEDVLTSQLVHPLPRVLDLQRHEVPVLREAQPARIAPGDCLRKSGTRNAGPYHCEIRETTRGSREP